MSSDAAIQVRSLGKDYTITSARAPGERRASLLRRQRERVTALDAVDLEVSPGEVLGLIGRNGAGKSTLLKVLSRITEPTRGVAVLRGRVGSLLEVGTGFHPELTGRENVFLNGTILGMRRREVARRFDEILAFAGVERFVDTPVKRYSSGMYVRLAFSVAAHLDADILIVDEVLAVGDADFQRRCLGKMGEVSAEQGRTVVFVSHNMAAIENLCGRAVLLEGGRIAADGPTPAVVDRYLRSAPGAGTQASPGTWRVGDRAGGPGTARPVISEVRLLDRGGRGTDVVPVGAPLTISFTTEGLADVGPGPIGVRISTETGQEVVAFTTRMRPLPAAATAAREHVSLDVASVPLVPGRYWISIGIKDAATGSAADVVERGAAFEVVPADVFGTGYALQPADGLVVVDATWRREPAG